MGRASGCLLYKYVLQREKIKHKTNYGKPQICQITFKVAVGRSLSYKFMQTCQARSRVNIQLNSIAWNADTVDSN